jgi:FkbM family methyltransferase
MAPGCRRELPLLAVTRRTNATGRALEVLVNRLGEPLGLVDVGARGGVDERWKPFYPVLDVLGFEPDPAECERLNQAAHGLPYASRFLPYALGRDEGQVTFNVCRWPVASSIYEPNPEVLEDFPLAAGLMTVTERRALATVRLDEVCAREAVMADCVKVDVEGAELDVLRGAETTLERVLVLDVEVEFDALFRGQPLFADLDVHLRERGWRLLGLRRLSWRRTAGLSPGGTGYGGQLMSADALYLNDRALKRGLTATQALKLAAILSAYRQHDFTLALLRRPPLSELPGGERRVLEAGLAPTPSVALRVAARAVRRLDSERRRRIADALHDGAATVWQDAHHF